MEFPRKQIKANARAALKGYYWPCVGYPLLVGLIIGAATGAASFAVAAVTGIGYGTGSLGMLTVGFIIAIAIDLAITFVALVIAAGQCLFFYRAYRAERPEFETFFAGFKNGQTWHIIGGLLLMCLKIFLWSLLLFIPGIIKSYEYSMVPYLLIDEPKLTVSECFKASKQMTTGYKGGLFVLDLSFIGWMLLASITMCLVGIFYAFPYYTLASAGAYDFLKTTRFEQSSQEAVAEQA